MSILKKAKKKVITIEYQGGDRYTIKASQMMNPAEMCDALLGAFATVATYMVANGMPPEVLKELTMQELDELLQVKKEAREEEDDDKDK